MKTGRIVLIVILAIIILPVIRRAIIGTTIGVSHINDKTATSNVPVSPNTPSVPPAPNASGLSTPTNAPNVDVLYKGKDVKGFLTAKEMYKTDTIIPFNSKAEILTKSITASLQSGSLPEKQNVWPLLEKLNPYRKSKEVVALIPGWISMAVKNIENFKENKSYTCNLITIKEFYDNGNFEEASSRYKKVLINRPYEVISRNNLALAEMHRNNDLIAWLELEVIGKTFPLYTPAKVNLTVVYERLGMTKKSDSLANALYNKPYTTSIIPYNAAWYANKNKDFLKANQMLSYVKLSDNQKYQSFDTLNNKELKESSLVKLQMSKLMTSTWSHGIYGKFKSKDREWLKTVLIIIFILITNWVTNAIGKAGNFNYYSFGQVFFRAVPFLIFMFILFWGIPDAMAWLWFGIYTVGYLFYTFYMAAKK
jgi:hypothetical protein